MNDMENFEELNSEIKQMLDDIEHVKSNVDLYGIIVDEQLLTLV